MTLVCPDRRESQSASLSACDISASRKMGWRGEGDVGEGKGWMEGRREWGRKVRDGWREGETEWEGKGRDGGREGETEWEGKGWMEAAWKVGLDVAYLILRGV